MPTRSVFSNTGLLTQMVCLASTRSFWFFSSETSLLKPEGSWCPLPSSRGQPVAPRTSRPFPRSLRGILRSSRAHFWRSLSCRRREESCVWGSWRWGECWGHSPRSSRRWGKCTHTSPWWRPGSPQGILVPTRRTGCKGKRRSRILPPSTSDTGCDICCSGSSWDLTSMQH